MTSGDTSLALLLADMRPEMHETEFVFISVSDAEQAGSESWEPLAQVREAEGLTLVVPRHEARKRGFPDTPSFRCITLGVHSSLEAVGLTAAVAAQLAGHGIAANFLAGFHHDHVLVPARSGAAALECLRSLAGSPSCYAQARPAHGRQNGSSE